MAVKHGITSAPDKQFKAPDAIKQRAAEERYRIFAHHYVHNGLNAAQAAISAGYSATSATSQGCDLLAIPYVQEWIKKLQEEKKIASLVTRDWIITKLQNALRASEEGRTNEKGLYDSKSVAKVSEVLNKMHGYDAPVKTINVHQLSDNDDRDKRLAEALIKYESPR